MPAYLSTHPAYPERILKMIAILPRAEAIYRERKVIGPTVIK